MQHPNNETNRGIVARTLGKEVVQPGGMGAYFWPLSNPELVEQPYRLLTNEDLSTVYRVATPGTPDPESLRRNTRGKIQPETILYVMSRETFNFNGPAVNREPLWQQRTAEAVQRGSPVRLVYPLMCKVGNWAKQMTNIGPNAAELACLYFFNHLNRVVKEFYPPGVLIELVCDAHLYNSAIQLPYHQVNSYVHRFAELAREISPQNVRMHDYCDLLEQLDGDSRRRYEAAYKRVYRQLSVQPDEVLDTVDRANLTASVRALVNTRRLGLSYEDHRAIFGPAPDQTNPNWVDVEAMTQVAVREMVATRMACSELDVLGKTFPDMVRVSCHRGLKNQRAVIGLRVYPEYYRSSLFLPYHGIAVLWGGDCPRLEVHPEIVLRGDPNLVRVLQPDGDVFCYRAPAGWKAPAAPRGTNGTGPRGGDRPAAA
jgi:pyoverdine/dityrosine biosynthesis protein Dit1